jgi:uncharacterized protein (DUF1501 family)
VTGVGFWRFYEEGIVAETIQDGYDTHAKQLSAHARLLRELSGAVKAFLDDLQSAGLADRVLVVCFSEFGRRAAENASFGTDHGTAGPVFIAGNKIFPGPIGQPPSMTDLEDGDLKTARRRTAQSGIRPRRRATTKRGSRRATP